MPGARSNTHCEVDGLEVGAGHAPFQLLHGSIRIAHGQQHLEADEGRIDGSRLALFRDVDIVERPGNMMSRVKCLTCRAGQRVNRKAWSESNHTLGLLAHAKMAQR